MIITLPRIGTRNCPLLPALTIYTLIISLTDHEYLHENIIMLLGGVYGLGLVITAVRSMLGL